MNNNERKFSLDELSGLLDLPRRTVRYYIQIGLIDRPEGAGRGAHYSTRHLDQLLEIKKWQEAGLSLDRIREILDNSETGPLLPPPRQRQKGQIEVWSHILINDGLELNIDPTKAGLTPEMVRELAAGVMELYDNIKLDKEKSS